MGAPNLMRGGSHVGYMSVAAAAAQGVLDCLCSDYHYPSLFQAPFQLAQQGLMPFAAAWATVSSHPARAAGLGHCKGSIAPDYDADFLLVRPMTPFPAAIQAVYVGGKLRVLYSSPGP
jgi:alpha-D-ribose 1-methylphosphonate 5-triphosphate diphosphatase